MFVTTYGNFNGTSWENMMQVIFKRKYMASRYQRMMASPGDFGVEGYTKDGQTFQCYCPEVNMDNSLFYQKQRDKITADINKLKTNEKELHEILGGVILKTWILVTPRMAHRDLLLHCNKKRDQVRLWNLPFIDPNEFEVLVHEADDYAIEIGEYFNQAGKKISINPKQDEASKEKIVQWKNTEIDLVQNALGKNEIRVNSIPAFKGNPERANELTNETAKYYLNGESILRTWQSAQPENHQRFIELLASVEEELKERSLLSIVDPNEFVKEVSEYVEKKIQSSFSYLDESTVIRLKNYATSFWLLRCPLYFETSGNEGNDN